MSVSSSRQIHHPDSFVFSSHHQLMFWCLGTALGDISRVFIVSPSSGLRLTLIAGLAGETRVAFALVRSHAVSVLTGGLAHSCFQRRRDGSVHSAAP